MKYSNESRSLSGNELIFLGGVGGHVTGSCNRLNAKNLSILVDCGLFQGKKDERSDKGERRNFAPTDFAHGVSDVLLTHAHIDHSGLIPRIFKNGFQPNIVVPEVTAQFLETLLYNSAKIQENEHPENRLYETKDVDNTLRRLKIVKPFEIFPIGQKHSKYSAEFLTNGHVMGASSIFINSLGEDGHKQNILFTGDMGKPHQSLCDGYLAYSSNYPTDQVHVLIAESTNFSKEPVSFEDKKNSLINEIKKTWEEGGTPLIPSLSFHRLQEILEILHNSQGNLLPKDCQIYLDAPLGVELLNIFQKLNPEELTNRYGDDPDFYKNTMDSLNRFSVNNLKIINTHQDSLLNDQKFADSSGHAIIIASGGMGEHGRIVNYLHGSFSENPKNSILFTCHQVEGTKGESISRYENLVRNNKKGARVKKLDKFTSHISGPKETFGFLNRFNMSDLQVVIINHGNDTSREAMAKEFKSRGFDGKIILPKLSQKVGI